jgi:hypothetical protein
MIKIFYPWEEVRLSPLGTPATIGPTVPDPDDDDDDDDDERGAVGEIRIVRRNRNICRKPTPKTF